MSEPVLTLDHLVPGVAFPRENDNLTFEGLDLSNAILSGSVFRNCSFREVKLFKARVHGTQFVDCTFEGCDLGRVQGRGVLFMQCLMIGGSLHYANLPFSELSYSKFREVSAARVGLVGCHASYTSFMKVAMPRALLQFSHFDLTSFEVCDLSEADLQRSFLEECSFQDCDLEKVVVHDTRGFVIPEGWCLDPKCAVASLVRKKNHE